MPRFKRKIKSKVPRKARSGRKRPSRVKKGHGRKHNTHYVSMPKMPKLIFPDELRVTVGCDCTGYSGISTNDYSISFHGNGFGNGSVGTQGVGPDVNWSGSFLAANQPSGIYYLLGTPVTSGSTAPYSQYRVLASRIKVRLVPDQYLETAGGATPTCAIQCVLIPSTHISFSGMSQVDFLMQPYCKDKVIMNPMLLVGPQATVTSAWIPQATNVVTMKGSMSTTKIFGIGKEAVSIEPTYQSQYNGSATAAWYWHCVVWGMTDSNSYNVSWQVELEYDTIFFNRNELLIEHNV